MRILIIHREYPPETGWGGIATFNYHLAHGLRGLGHEVHVLSFNYETPSDTWQEGVRVIRICSYIRRLMPWHVSMFLYFWMYQRHVWRVFRALHARHPYDVVDCADHLGEAFGLIRRQAAPTTLRFYSPWSWVASRSMNYREKYLDIKGVRWLEAACVHGANVLTSPSHDLAGHVREFFRIRRPIHVIGNPLDVERFSPVPMPPGRPVRALFLGRLEPRKGPDILAEAIPLVVRQFPDIRFTFLGSDCPGRRSPSTREELREFLAARGVLDHVDFHDPVPLMELPRWYGGAHFIVTPSRYDNSPYVCQEAMSCGRPVIGTSAGGMKEYLNHGQAGRIVPPDDPRALAEAILELARDADLRQRLGQAARRRVLEEYDRRVIAARTCELYEQAIRLHRRATGGQASSATEVRP